MELRNPASLPINGNVNNLQALNMQADVKMYRPKNIGRVITATSLLDGHGALTNIMRRIMQDSRVEVIHLAHNRSVQGLVHIAIQEDAQGIPMSSYHGGHLEALKHKVDLLRENSAGHIKVFGGGGGGRIHMNSIEKSNQIYVQSLATQSLNTEKSAIAQYSGAAIYHYIH